MTTHQRKIEDPKGSAVDSFETNLLQIEQTNRLLANIENKLSNFFHKNTNIHQPHAHEVPQTDERGQVFQEQQIPVNQNKENFMPNIGDMMLSPIQNKDSFQHFLSAEYDPNSKGINRYINIVDSSKREESDPTSIDQDSSYCAYKHKEPLLLNKHSLNHNKNAGLQGMNRVSPVRHRLEEGSPAYKRGTQKTPNRERRTIKSKGRGTSEPKNGSAEKIIDVEKKFYEKKIQVLEERLEVSEGEINNLVKIKSTLNSEIARLKSHLKELQSRFVEDLTKSLKAQEERFKKELNDPKKFREERDTFKYIQKIEELTIDKVKLQQELFELKLQTGRNRYEKEEDTLSKHKKTGTSEGRGSVGRNQEGRLSVNHLKSLMDSLNMYKQELEVLKENNNIVQAKYNEEMQALREQLNRQKEKNMKLEEKIRVQNEILAKYQNIALELSTRKDADEIDAQSLVKFDVVDLLSDGEESEKGRENSNDCKIEGRCTHQPHKETGRGSHKMTQKKRYSSPKILQERDNVSEVNSKGRVSYTNTQKSRQSNVPFTNLEIKSSIISKKGKKRGRDALSGEFLEPKKAPELEKNRSKTRSKSRSRKRKASEDEIAKSKNESRPKSIHKKSPGTAYEELQEELQRVKGIVSTRLLKKDSKRKNSTNERESLSKKDRRASQDFGGKKEKLENRIPVTARGAIRDSPVNSVGQRSSSTSRPRTGSRKI